MTKIALTAVTAGALSAAALLLAPAAAAPVRPVQRRADGQPTQGRRLHRHRQQSRRRPGRPVHRGRGPCRPDLRPVGFRNTRSPGRHPHHRHRQDRIRRPRLLSSHAPQGAISRRCCPAAIALSCRAADYGLRRVCWVTTAAPHRSSQSSPMQSNAHQQNMSHRYVKPDQHPDLRSRLCSKSTDRNLLAGRDVIGPMEHRRRPMNRIVSSAVLPDKQPRTHPAGAAHPLARGRSTKRVPSFPVKNWR